jgi:hypothetical protein
MDTRLELLEAIQDLWVRNHAALHLLKGYCVEEDWRQLLSDYLGIPGVQSQADGRFREVRSQILALAPDSEVFGSLLRALSKTD